MNPEPTRQPENLGRLDPGADAASTTSEALDRLWEATRPERPSAAAWETLWAGVTCAADSAPRTIRPAAWWASRGVLVRVVMAAAAVVVVGWLVSREWGESLPGRADIARTIVAEPVIETGVSLEPGRVAILRIGDRGTVRVETRNWDTTPAEDLAGVGFGSSATELDAIAALEDMGTPDTLALGETDALP